MAVSKAVSKAAEHRSQDGANTEWTTATATYHPAHNAALYPTR